MNTNMYMFNKIIRLAISFFILYLIFTNPGTFLMIIFSIIAVGYFLFQYLKKKLRTNANTFNFRFDSSQFTNNSGFRYEDFSNFQNTSSIGEVQKAKDFFGFSGTYTKEDIKKRYKELAKKYHPDINKGDDTKMKELNHYKDVLMGTV